MKSETPSFEFTDRMHINTRQRINYLNQNQNYIYKDNVEHGVRTTRRSFERKLQPATILHEAARIIGIMHISEH